MSAQLTLRGVTKSYRGRVVLDHVSLTVRPGERVGLVGENGSGKSTLLRLIAGLAAPDEGTITVTADHGVGHLGQTLGLPPESTVGEAVDAALADNRHMEHRMRELEADLTGDRLAEYGDLLSAYEFRGGYEADARVEKALQALGVGHIEATRPLSDLSGGEQARLGLACLLAAAPEVLLLDEPTNHLDEASLTWLEDRLRAQRGIMIVVSHDRLFLERVATAIIEVADGAVTRYGGGYRGFPAERAAARRRWEQAYESWREEIERLEAAVATTARRVAPGRAMKDNNKMAYDRNAGRVQSSIAGRIHQAEERLRRLLEDAVPRPPEPLRFGAEFAGGATQGVLAEVQDVRVGDRLAIERLRIETGQRLLVHGPNGAGKSTLLRLLAGEVVPDTGTVRRRGRIAYLPQEVPPAHDRRTLLAAFAAGRPGYEDEHRARLLALGLFRPEQLEVPVGRLSVGQQRRLALARLLADEPPDLMLLDEPTNHLSVALITEFEAALAAYPGALVLVTHDRSLRAGFTGTTMKISDGRIQGEQ